MTLLMVWLKRIPVLGFSFVNRRSVSILIRCSKMRYFLSLFFALFVYIMRCKIFRRHCLILRVNFHHWKWFISCIIVSLWLYSLYVLISYGPVIVYDKLGSRSFIIVYLQAWSNEVFIMVTDLDIRFKHLIDGSCCYFLEQDRLNFFLPWKMPINHLISDNSNTPNITFVGVSIEF